MKAVFTLLLFASAGFAQSQSGPRMTDVYHVHFNKAAPGKAAALADFLKTQDPKAPMKGHYLVLRHEEGDTWDYAAIEHMGTKATVDLSGGTPTPAAARDASDWHTDAFVSGPPWADFAAAMGMSDAARTSGSVYVVSVFRAVPGHRDELLKALGTPQGGAGSVLMQHLEGGPWQYFTVTRHNSWQDLAKSEEADAVQTKKNAGGWFDMRNHAAYHTDTLADRIAP